MIIFVSEKQVRSNLKKYNVQSFDKGVFEKVNQSLLNFSQNLLAKVVKKNKDVKKIDNDHVRKALSGGRVLLPSEYFGVASNHYVDNAAPGHEMTSTDTLIRPAMEIHGPMVGGAPSFVVSERAIKAAVSEALVRLNADVTVKGSVIQEMKRKYESEMSAVMRNVAKKNNADHLKEELLVDVLKMKKYKLLQKD